MTSPQTDPGRLPATPHRLPVEAGIQFAHATVQVLAGSRDVLHIKGPALDPVLTMGPAGEGARRTSVDADVLVRPSQVVSLLGVMERHGWTVYSMFEEGSSFEHATTMCRDGLPSVDVHRQFPGIRVAPEAAFDVLWRDRDIRTIGGLECTVPSVAAQRLILLLNIARGGSARRDFDAAWGSATEPERAAVRALARELEAEVPLAAAIGELDLWRHRREHDMWRLLVDGSGTATQLWWARVKAERDVLAGVRRGFRLVVPTRHRMSLAAGRELHGRDLLAAYADRFTSMLRRGRRGARP